MRLTEWQQREMDIASGEEMDRHAARQPKAYRGEDATSMLFGNGIWHIAPTACCVCSRLIGGVDDEWGLWFWSSTNGEGRALCSEDHKRYWNDRTA